MLKLTAKKSKWFPVTQDASGETQIEVTHLKPGEVADIEAKANSITQKQYDNSEFVTEIDFKLNDRTKAYVLASITDWKGFAGVNEKTLKCTDFNKLAVLNEYEWFGPFVEECRADLLEEFEEESEGATKN